MLKHPKSLRVEKKLKTNNLISPLKVRSKKMVKLKRPLNLQPNPKRSFQSVKKANLKIVLRMKSLS
jgi:hypothetical protein